MPPAPARVTESTKTNRNHNGLDGNQLMSDLTHYTGDVETVLKILRNGFAWMDNKRNLIQQLVPMHDFSLREPQQFGMISFTESQPPAPAKHLKDFGCFGIVVSRKWAESHFAQRVLYVASEGPVLDSLRMCFTTAYNDLTARIRYPDDGAAQMAFNNKMMAGVQGGQLWSNLLTLYEYLEPEEHSYQSEWRIVHPQPLYGYGSRAQTIERVSPPRPGEDK
jgi:hypothetical protein